MPSLKAISRVGIGLLFLLSLLSWFYVPNLFAWELSIVTTQLGPFLALVVLALWMIGRPRDFVSVIVAIAAIASFCSPLVCALLDHPGMLSVAQVFSPVETRLPYQRFVFSAANGKTPLNLDYYPAVGAQTAAGGGSSATVPWVLSIHGGGWINGDSQHLPEINSHLARQGYAVISIDYRLSPGWLWPAPKDDTLEALKFIRAHASEWHLDLSHWVIMGRSAGAQIAGVVAYTLHGTDKPSGFISYYDPTDLVFGYGIGVEDDILHSRQLLRGFLGGTPEEKPALYESASVMESVTDDGCPALLIHGLRDTIVWVKHSQRLYEVLKMHKIPAQLVLMRFGPHGFDYFFNGPEAQVATTAVDRFLTERFLVR